MPGRTPYEAVRSFIQPLQSGVSCLTRAVLETRGGYHPADQPHPLTLGDADPVRLSGVERLSFAMRMLYRVVEAPIPAANEPWAVITVGYAFTFYGRDAATLIAYHWHPEGRSSVTTPHLHLGASAVTQNLLAAAHLSTGPMTLVDMVDLAIRELDVRPLRGDWADVLARARTGLGG